MREFQKDRRVRLFQNSKDEQFNNAFKRIISTTHSCVSEIITATKQDIVLDTLQSNKKIQTSLEEFARKVSGEIEDFLSGKTTPDAPQMYRALTIHALREARTTLKSQQVDSDKNSGAYRLTEFGLNQLFLKSVLFSQQRMPAGSQDRANLPAVHPRLQTYISQNIGNYLRGDFHAIQQYDEIFTRFVNSPQISPFEE